MTKSATFNVRLLASQLTHQFGQEVVSVSTASAIKEVLAHAVFLAEIPSGDFSLTGASVGREETDV